MRRIGLAFRLFFRVLTDAAFFERMASGASAPAEEAKTAASPAPAAAPAALKPPARNEAVSLLAMLQREARLVDFLQESISAHSDEQIGAAVRDVHRASAAVLERVFGLQPVLPAEEGAQVDVPDRFDAARFHLAGRVAEQPPYRGVLVHHGWEATRTALPSWTGSADAALVIAPAVVELA